MITHDDEPAGRQRYQPTTAPHDFSDEELARDWTLSAADIQEIGTYRRTSRLFIAVQMCAVRLYSRFLVDVHDLSPRIVSYLIRQLDLPPSLTIRVPDREATLIEQRKQILAYLEFSRYDPTIQGVRQRFVCSRAIVHNGENSVKNKGFCTPYDAMTHLVGLKLTKITVTLTYKNGLHHQMWLR